MINLLYKVNFDKIKVKFTLRCKDMKPELINRPQYLNRLIDFIATKDCNYWSL